MAENQIIEYKESCRDEHLKWICGFANAQGGTLYIGIDDNGNAVGVRNVKKLMDDIPNKIQSVLGIVAEVNKKTKKGLDYIEIRVNPSNYPVSYHGEYHYRSGSTKQLLTGMALSEFIMRKTGVRWEDVTVDGITVEDLDDESFKIFRREALRSNRMTREDLDITNEELLNKLHLVADGKLKRSAVLLFYSEPSRIQTGSVVKIGRFSDDTELLYQDVLEDSLIKIADKVIDLIYLKYLKAKITYIHDKRVDTYPFARDAIREAVYNAIAHNCYMFGTPIQIRIEDESLIISNRCILPEGWTVETLMQPHESIPYNENIANVFYYAGYIETWGRGIQKICKACAEIGADNPRYELIGNGLRVHFAALKSALIGSSQEEKETELEEHSQKTAQKTAQKILNCIRQNPFVSRTKLAELCGITPDGIKWQLKSLQEHGVVSRVGADRGGYWKINETAIENTSGKTEVSNDRLGEKLGENRATIMRYLIQNPTISIHRLADLLGMSKTAMDKNIKWLQAKGLVRHVGPAKGGHWEVIKK